LCCPQTISSVCYLVFKDPVSATASVEADYQLTNWRPVCQSQFSNRSLAAAAAFFPQAAKGVYI
jgi:hypothetical protein